MNNSGISFLKILVKRLQVLLIGIFLVIGVCVAFIPKIKKRKELIQKKELLQQKIAQIEQEIEELRKRELAVQNNPNYLEQLARDKLGYSGPNEIIYKFE